MCVFSFYYFLQAEKVREKTYNKQKVCVVNQDLMVSASGDVNIAQIDNQILELTREKADHEAFIKRALSEIKTMTSSMSIEDAEELLAKVQFYYCDSKLYSYQLIIKICWID